MKSYTLPEAEAIIKEIDHDFSIRENPNSELAGIYWKDFFAEISVPKETIFETRNEGYTDEYGHPHRGLDDLKSRCEGFLSRIKSDEDYYKDITDTWEE